MVFGGWRGEGLEFTSSHLTHSTQCPTQSWVLLNSRVHLHLTQSGTETHFIKLVLEVIKLCILMKQCSNCNPLPSAIPMCHNLSKFHWISSYFTISWASTDATHSGWWGVCWQNSDFDPDVADSLSSYSSKQVCETSLHDSLQITVFRLSLMLKI